MTEFVRTALLLLAAYLVAGGLFALVFHLRGLRAIDAAARGAGFTFRLLITPGVIALWPLVAARWLRAIQGGVIPGGQEGQVSPRRLRATHAFAWKALAVLVPLAVAAALWNRPLENRPSQLKNPIPEGRSQSAPR